MFDLKVNSKGEKVLRFSDRPRMPFERGLWVDIAHERDREANKIVEINREMGLEVEKDENGFYRALVLKD